VKSTTGSPEDGIVTLVMVAVILVAVDTLIALTVLLGPGGPAGPVAPALPAEPFAPVLPAHAARSTNTLNAPSLKISGPATLVAPMTLRILVSLSRIDRDAHPGGLTTGRY
jgi:hypothetical protein